MRARRAQAADLVTVAGLSAVETRRQTALAAADAYLTILARAIPVRVPIDRALSARRD